MKIPLKYTLRNFKSRRLTTAITMTGIALVVFVFAAVLMLAHGIQKTLVATGMPDNVIVARKAANGEISSIIVRNDYNILLTLPHIAKQADGLLEIKSPMVGTFYAAQSPDAAPYVEVNLHIDSQTVVCVIEAMKVMNEIKAEISGTITEVLVTNGQAVEFGQVLFKVKPD